jgi:hypothetical protein
MSNPTNADIMRELGEVRSSVTGLREQVDSHEQRIGDLESMRILVVKLHSELAKIREAQTVDHEILTNTDKTIAAAMRTATGQIVESARAAVKAEVGVVLERLDCLGCASKAAGPLPAKEKTDA